MPYGTPNHIKTPQQQHEVYWDHNRSELQVIQAIHPEPIRKGVTPLKCKLNIFIKKIKSQKVA